jgi:hypothetical protein
VSAFVDEHRDRFGVETICREIEVSASAYRARRTRPPSARSVRDAWLLTQIRRVHAGCHGIYGQLKIWDELNDEGIKVARCTIERLMRGAGIEGFATERCSSRPFPGPAPVPTPNLASHMRQSLRAEQGPHRHGARQRHGRERDVDTQAGADQTLHVEDTPDETASAAAGARAVQSASRPGDRGTHVIEPTWNPGRSTGQV